MNLEIRPGAQVATFAGELCLNGRVCGCPWILQTPQFIWERIAVYDISGRGVMPYGRLPGVLSMRLT